MNKVQPITPEEAGPGKARVLPDEVIQVWNDTIARNVVNGVAKIGQSEIITALMVKTKCPRPTVFNEHWLDIEDLYRSAGWVVNYDKPGYDENYEASFTFAKAKK